MIGQKLDKSPFHILLDVLYPCLFGAIAALVALSLTNNFGGDKATYFLFGFLTLLVFGPLIQRLMLRSLNLAEPGVWFAVYYFTHFGIRGIYDLKLGSPILGLGPGASDLASLNAALVVSIVGILMFWLGYHLRFGKVVARSLPVLPPRWGRGRALQTALLCLGLGWGFRIFLIFYQAGGLVAWLKADKYILFAQAEGTMYFAILSELATIGALILFILGKVRRQFGYWFLFSLLLIPEVMWRFLSGSRAQFIFFLISLLIASYLISDRSHRVSMRYAKWAIGLVALLVLLFPLFSVLRAGIVRPNETLRRTYEFWRAPDQLFALIGARQVGLDSLALLIERVPEERPYTFVSELALVAFAWIPRKIWPDKPIISLGKVFYQEFYPPIYHEGTSVAITLPGQFYWDFGYAGVVAGMFVVGVLWRVFFEYFIKPKQNLSNVLVASFVFPCFFILAEQTLVELFTSHLLEFAIVIVVSLAMRGKTVSLGGCQ